jgi:branched-chain amino acid transport system permease protein
VIDNAVLFSFGKDPRGMPPGVLTNGAFTISGIRIRYIQAIIPLVGLLVAVGLRILFRATRTGKAMLAIVQNREAAQLMGVNARQFIVGAYGISGPLAGIAGVLISPLFTVSSTMGTLFGIKAFAVAILGGIGNAWGVVLAGLIYGVAEALITAAIGSTYTQIITFSLIIAALALRPDGLGNACWDCRTIGVLDAGVKIAHGPPERVASDPKVIQAYLEARQSVDRAGTDRSHPRLSPCWGPRG